MTLNGVRNVFRGPLRVRPGITSLAVFVVLVGLMNWLVVNQKVVLYLFYFPVVFASLVCPRRQAVGIASLAALLVVAYAVFLPRTFAPARQSLLLWAELVIWGGILVLTAYTIATLKGRIQAALFSLRQAYEGVLAILSRFIQTVDADTEAHCVRVAAYAVQLAREMKMSDEQVEEIRIAGLLHDVGKVEVSVQLLRKAAALSKEEFEQIQEHTTRGAAIVRPVGGMLTHIAAAVETHHEKYDGSGYMGLKGEEIPILARIIAVADVFDALLSDRPCRKGLGLFEALDNVVASVGSYFDPAVIAALKTIVDRQGEQDTQPVGHLLLGGAG